MAHHGKRVLVAGTKCPPKSRAMAAAISFSCANRISHHIVNMDILWAMMMPVDCLGVVKHREVKFDKFKSTQATQERWIEREREGKQER